MLTFHITNKRLGRKFLSILERATTAIKLEKPIFLKKKKILRGRFYKLQLIVALLARSMNAECLVILAVSL